MVPAMEPSRRTSISAPAARGVEPRSPISFTSAKSSPLVQQREDLVEDLFHVVSSGRCVDSTSVLLAVPTPCGQGDGGDRDVEAQAPGGRPRPPAPAPPPARRRPRRAARRRRPARGPRRRGRRGRPRAAGRRGRRAPAAARTAPRRRSPGRWCRRPAARARPQYRARTRSSRRSGVPHGHGSDQEPAAVAGPVAHQRHGLARQRGEDDLAVLAVRHRLGRCPGRRPRRAGRPRAGGSRPGPRTRRRRRGPSRWCRSGRRRGSPTPSSIGGDEAARRLVGAEQDALEARRARRPPRRGAPARAPARGCRRRSRTGRSGARAAPSSGSRDRPVHDALHVHPREAAAQQVADAARPLAGQQDEHALPGAHQHRHAVVEEVERELLVGGGEVDALGLARGPRRREGDDPVDLSRVHAEEAHALRADVVRRW